MADDTAFNLNNYLPDETFDFPGQTKKAFCWAYYLFSPGNELARCRDCGTTIKCKNGGTKSCNDHLKHIHGIVDGDNLKRMNETDELLAQKKLKLFDFDHMLQQEFSQPENDEEYSFNTSSVVVAENNNKQFFRLDIGRLAHFADSRQNQFDRLSISLFPVASSSRNETESAQTMSQSGSRIETTPTRPTLSWTGHSKTA